MGDVQGTGVEPAVLVAVVAEAVIVVVVIVVAGVAGEAVLLVAIPVGRCAHWRGQPVAVRLVSAR